MNPLSLPALAAKLAAASTTRDRRCHKAAVELEAAVADFRPEEDLVGGSRRLTAALARANGTYLDVVGERLFEPQATAATKPPPKVRLCERPDPEPPEAA